MAVNARDAMRGEGEMSIRVARGRTLPPIRAMPERRAHSSR